MQSDNIGLLMEAMNRAQLKMVPAKKDSDNPFFHSKYADLATVWDALAPFREEGIVLTQSPAESPDEHIVLDTQLTHVSGQWMRSRLKMKVAKNDPQGYGSAITYARRYALGAMTGLVTEVDDDGNAASQAPTGLTYADKYPTPAPKPAPALVVPPAPSQAPSEAGFVWRVGKHKEESIVTIDTSYLEWFAREGKRADHVAAANLELDRRNAQELMTLDQEEVPEAP